MANRITKLGLVFRPSIRPHRPAKIIFILFALFLSHSALSQTVYVTRTGEKYHNAGCRYLSKSQIKTTLTGAKENGYTACSVCKPTTKVTPSQKQTVTTAPAPVRKVTSSQCTARTKANNRCARMTTNSNGKCWQHQ